MTQSEALKLEAGAELDALVAEHIFGAQWHGKPKGNRYLEMRGVGTLFNIEVGKYAGRSSTANLKPYSTDISAAWEVVKVLREQWGSFCLATGDGDVWFCYDHDGIGSLHGIGPTPMLAICRAAIRHMMKA